MFVVLHVTVVAQTLVDFEVRLYVLGIFLPTDVRIRRYYAEVYGQAYRRGILAVCSQVNLEHAEVWLDGRANAQLVCAFVGHGRKPERQVVLADDVYLVALHVVLHLGVIRNVAPVGVLGVPPVLEVARGDETPCVILYLAEAVGHEVGAYRRKVITHALVEHSVGHFVVVDEDFVYRVVETVDCVVGVFAVALAHKDTGTRNGYLLIRAVEAVVVSGVTVYAFAFCCAAFGKLEQATRRPHCFVVFPAVY